MELFQKIIAVIFILLSGLLMLTRPDIIWKLEHFFSVKDGEPTEWYITIVRIIGLGFIFISAFLAIVFLFFG